MSDTNEPWNDMFFRTLKVDILADHSVGGRKVFQRNRDITADDGRGMKSSDQEIVVKTVSENFPCQCPRVLRTLWNLPKNPYDEWKRIHGWKNSAGKSAAKKWPSFVSKIKVWSRSPTSTAVSKPTSDGMRALQLAHASPLYRPCISTAPSNTTVAMCPFPISGINRRSSGSLKKSQQKTTNPWHHHSIAMAPPFNGHGTTIQWPWHPRFNGHGIQDSMAMASKIQWPWHPRFNGHGTQDSMAMAPKIQWPWHPRLHFWTFCFFHSRFSDKPIRWFPGGFK